MIKPLLVLIDATHFFQQSITRLHTSCKCLGRNINEGKQWTQNWPIWISMVGPAGAWPKHDGRYGTSHRFDVGEPDHIL